MRLARNVHDLLRAAELVDRLGDEALRPALARASRSARRDRRRRFALRAGRGHKSRRASGCVNIVPGSGTLAVRHIDRRRGRPMIAEQLLDHGDGGAGALHNRMAALRVIDRRRQHVFESHGAVVAQQQHPGIEHARHAGRQQAGARHHVEAERSRKCAMVSAGRRRPLPADDLRLAALHVIENDRHVAARPVQMRLDDLQREGGGDAGIEGVAASFQNAHADRGRDPVRRGDHAEGAFDLGPGGERIGIDLGNAGAHWTGLPI